MAALLWCFEKRRDSHRDNPNGKRGSENDGGLGWASFSQNSTRFGPPLNCISYLLTRVRFSCCFILLEKKQKEKAIDLIVSEWS